MMLHDCKAITFGDLAEEKCTICQANLALPPYNDLVKSIQRVRELAEKFEKESIDELVRYQLIASRIFKALDGEQ